VNPFHAATWLLGTLMVLALMALCGFGLWRTWVDIFEAIFHRKKESAWTRWKIRRIMESSKPPSVMATEPERR